MEQPKKLKKIKIIEDGRTCSSEELNLLKGGCDRNYVTCMSGYLSCNIVGYKSCAPTSFAGYTSNGSDTFCASGYTYNQCVVGPTYQTCPSGRTYSTY